MSLNHQKPLQAGSMNHWADYVVFVLVLCISLGIGLYHAITGGKQTTTEEFIMANRKLKVLPTAASLMASFLSAILVLGTPAEVYRFGTQKWLMNSVALTLGVLIAVQLVVPWLYPLKLTSVFEYLELRYSKCRPLKLYAIFLGLINIICYMGVVTYGPAVALETATGLPLVWSIAISVTLSTLYTALGGMKAVVWTDVFQGLIMLGGILTILIKGSIGVGGIRRAYRVAADQGRTQWLDFSPDPTVRHTFWGFTFGMTMIWVKNYAIHQVAVQRFSAQESLHKAKLSMLLIIPFFLPFFSLAGLVGLVVFAYFHDTSCDPLVSKQIHSANQILPLFVKDQFSSTPGILGLFVATLFSGSLSTASSGLSGCAAILWKDIIGSIFPNLSDHKAVIFNRCAVVLFGLITAGIAFLASSMPGPIMQVTNAFSGASGGPLLAIFLLAGIRKLQWMHPMGILVGSICGLVLNMWVTIGSMSVKKYVPSLSPVSTDQCAFPVNITRASTPHLEGLGRFYSLSYLWYCPLGLLSTVLIALMVCALIRWSGRFEQPMELEQHLFIDFRKIIQIRIPTSEPQDNKTHYKRAAESEMVVI